MKRAKIMLLAIAVVATVGGALAFKAQRFIDKNVYCATKNAQNVIYCTSTSFKTTNPGEAFVSTPCVTWHNALGLGAVRTSTYYTTTQDLQGNPCPNPIRATVTVTDQD
jgi:type II secretory pathway pseudopilin PulG